MTRSQLTLCYSHLCHHESSHLALFHHQLFLFWHHQSSHLAILDPSVYHHSGTMSQLARRYLTLSSYFWHHESSHLALLLSSFLSIQQQNVPLAISYTRMSGEFLNGNYNVWLLLDILCMCQSWLMCDGRLL